MSATIAAPTRILIPKREAFDAIGVGNTTGHKLINEGRIIARKIGSRTLIEADSLRDFAGSLPRLGSK